MPNKPFLIAQIHSWLLGQNDIEICYILGSYASGTQDRYSDLDLVIKLNRAPNIEDEERFKNSLKELLKMNIDLKFITLMSSNKISSFEKTHWSEERSHYLPAIFLKGINFTTSAPLTSEYKIHRAKKDLISAKNNLDFLRKCNSENPHLDGVYDFIDHDGEWFLVLRTFFKFFMNYEILANEKSIKKMAGLNELLAIKALYGRRVAISDSKNRKLIEDAALLIDQLYNDVGGEVL